jgi:type II secretory pathway component PulF
MPRYHYTAIDEYGVERKGTLEADSADMATNMLSARGLIPDQVITRAAMSSVGLASLGERFGTVKAEELIIFTKQFRTMLKSGVPIIRIFQILESQTENPILKRVVISMADDIREGASLYDAFQKYPRVFSRLYCSMVRAGEASGALPEVLERLSYIIEHENRIRSNIHAALQYPLIVVIFLGVAFIMLLTFVVPKFVRIFMSAGLDLPMPTRVCMGMYQFLAGYWVLLLGGGIAATVGLLYYFRTDQGRFVRDTFLLHVPVIGPLFQKAAMSRFASIFAILHSSGVEIRESMTILSGTIGNAAVAAEFDKVSGRLEEGRGISGPLGEAAYFTPIVVNMVGIGEESGELDEMLQEISTHYDFELEYAVKKLSDAIGPLLTIGLAVVVGFFALAIFLPMWDMTRMVK